MSNDDHIRAVIEDWARAVEAGDRAAILAHHAPDLLMFDFPETVQGLHAYERTWDFFFKDPRGPISFMPRDIKVTAGEDVAFASCLVHCDGTSAGPLDFRLTTGLRRIGGEWVIVHEHHSVPTKEERFIDGGKITMVLQPTFWAKIWGMLIDKFGTPWIVNGERVPF